MLQVEIEKLPSFLMGQQQGIEKGETKRALIIAKRLIKKNIPLEEIAEITGLDITELNTLQRFQIQLITKKYQNNNMAGVQALPARAGKACTPAIIKTA
ncbi:MAG: hypothetical protein U1D70_16785 [Methylobacter sp.]|nr:hypothetical protein [Methylobacter sp.]MDP2428213.1 hypothetical protein [Methylobacter sp.]MDP3055203.1 hypothetical protein [Methylobacter sp.]MDP3362514.1 hypothetical protein [Methylobacter sp.]MDZ4220661.1 hypothetical protein [Methylobacter sp.]